MMYLRINTVISRHETSPMRIMMSHLQNESDLLRNEFNIHDITS